MNTFALTLQGAYYDGDTPVGLSATVTINGKDAALYGPDISRTYDVRQLRISPRMGRSARFIALPDGGQFQCPDQPSLDRLPQEVGTEGPVAWLEERAAVAFASVVVIVGLVLFGYLYVLPRAAERVAARIPIESEKILGENILTWFDSNHWLKETHVAPERQNALRDGFSMLSEGLTMEPHFRLEFRCSKLLGPNAIALPGGTIVITDELVNLAKAEEEILAVLAHEIGHVERRHVVRQMLQGSVVGVAAAAITADATSIGTAVGGLPIVLANAKYSRGLEAEADEFAFTLLTRRGISPEAFASLMEKLGREDTNMRGMSFLSTHPATSERIKRARNARSEVKRQPSSRQFPRQLHTSQSQ